MFESTPLARVWVFSRRLSLNRGGTGPAYPGAGGMIAFAWYVWERGHSGPPTLGWLQHASPRRHKAASRITADAPLLA